MRSFIRYFVKHEVLVNLSIAIILLFGLIALYSLTSSFFPQQEPEFIRIEATYPGASPEEMEKGIVLKIEENLQGITGVERVTSVSRENSATISVEIFASTDENVVLQEVKNAVDRVSSFPEGLEQIVVFKEERVNLAGKLAVTGDVSLFTLKSAAERIENDLRTYDNISRVNLSGFTEAEIEIEVTEKTLRSYGLTFQDISRAVASANLEVTGGRLRGTQREYIIRADQKSYYAKGLANIVIRSRSDGSMVRLKDVATVKDAFAENTERGYLDGNPAVFIQVNTKNNEDILAASESIKAYIDQYNSRNQALQLVLVDDATKSLRDRIDLLQENGLLGGALVLILLGMFLRIRLAFWVALGIPISFCGMFILASFYGLTINVISLFGMIIVIGILVDDGIVVGEQIYQRYEEGDSPLEAAISGTIDVLPAVFSAIITTIIAFSFFFFIPGQLGEFFSEVSFVVSATLLISLIEVTIFLPAHLAHSKALQGSNGDDTSRFQDYFSNLLITVRDRAYVPALEFALKNKTLIISAAIGALILTFASISAGIIRTTFFPEVEQNTISVTLEMPRGTNDRITQNYAEKIEAASLRLNQNYRKELGIEKDIIQMREIQVGPGNYLANLTFYLLPAAQRSIRSFDIAADLREETVALPLARKLSFQTFSPFGKPVVVSLTSSNFEELLAASEQLKNELKQFPELTDVLDTQEEDQPEVTVTLFDRGRALGFTLGGVMQQVRDAYFGNEVQRLQRGENEIKVWTRYALEDRRSIGQLLRMRITAPNGSSYPLQEIADAQFTKGLVSINHREGSREIKVEAELSNIKVSTPEVLARIENEVMPEIQAAYPTIRYLFEGQARETKKVAGAASTVLPLILVLMFAMIVYTFKSTIQAISLLLIIPFAMIGVGWGHFIHDAAVGILSMLGIIALVGILVNDGLVFVTTFNEELRKGRPFDKALLETGRSRFRPVILTTSTTAVGLAPLIFEKSFQAQFLIPMAISVAYGLLIATFMLLALLPMFLVIANTLRRTAYWVWEGEWPEREDVEPAIREQNWERENE